MGISPEWEEFCEKGRYSKTNQQQSVRRSLSEDGSIRGYYSDFLLDPRLDCTDARYPSHDHRSESYDDSDMVVDARFINDMKTILSEDEFWLIIEHLFAVGIQKGKIRSRTELKKLADGWSPKRSYR